MSDWSQTIQRKVGRAGRPPVAHPRLKVFKVRANLEEEAMLNAGASAACLPIATFLRKRALGTVRFPVPKSDLQTAAQLARLGNLLNQAVALAHRGSAPAWPSQEMAELQNVCGRLAVLLIETRQPDRVPTLDVVDQMSMKTRDA
ncbi:hypothetical protein IVB38_28295 [Bradyrhizobium sp. 38]|uniref:plasmid mobilization protein n=1 Tax=unclassified Bradyrhizobium TaxID=2631580 RepID=UPI001FFB6EA0|nr:MULTISPECIES: hypothetical protein [unclassified Bradyrhizobium]MCK1339797.1 hypothetical protein [Bradyrhizobium sp. 38]MCK1782728.1 hypothetical protein [Bradyrhizobium sp. 132]